MEPIKEALEKAKAEGSPKLRRSLVAAPQPESQTAATPYWTLPQVRLDPAHLEQQRIVSLTMNDRSYIAFNLLRTKVYKALKDNGWKSLAVSSPTEGCGKTMVAVNLAVSLARQPDCKTVLIDLDVRRSAIASTLGIKAVSSIGQYLEGKADLEQCFVQISETLVVGTNNYSVKHSSEMMQSQRLSHMLQEVIDCLSPDVMVFDLPPLLSGDDAIAFLPRVDSNLLVIAAGETSAVEVDECQRQARAAGNFLGLVLNKCQIRANEYYGG